MAKLGNSQDGVEEELNIPEALVKDNRKCKMWSLDLCVRLTSIYFKYKSYGSIVYVYNIIMHLNRRRIRRGWNWEYGYGMWREVLGVNIALNCRDYIAGTLNGDVVLISIYFMIIYIIND